MGFANIYCGLAMRTLDKSISAVKGKRSLAMTRSMAYHPEVQHAVAQMVIELESIGPHRRRLVEGVNYGGEWPARLFAANTARSRDPGALSISVSRLQDAWVYSARQDTNACSARHASAEFIPQVPSSPTKSWQKLHWVSVSISSRAGVSCDGP
jgi:alkylation response protein AidB-like acyl-CoA dehydrogenase